MQLAEDEAGKLAKGRHEAKSAGGKSSQGKTRAKKMKLEGGKKASRDKSNAADKASRQASQKKRWKCKNQSCSFTCTSGNKSRDMPKHLERNPQCRVSENDYLSSFEANGWE